LGAQKKEKMGHNVNHGTNRRKKGETRVKRRESCKEKGVKMSEYEERPKLRKKVQQGARPQATSETTSPRKAIPGGE